MKCQRRILGIRWHDFVCNFEVSLRTGLASLSDRIIRGCNAIFGHVARVPDNTAAHQAMLRQVELSVGRLPDRVHQADHVPNGPTNSAATTTMFLLRLCGGKPLVAVTRERRYGPSRLRINDDDEYGNVGHQQLVEPVVPVVPVVLAQTHATVVLYVLQCLAHVVVVLCILRAQHTITAVVVALRLLAFMLPASWPYSIPPF